MLRGRHILCKFQKAINCLKQSLRAWFDKLSGVLLTFGFKQCHFDHSILEKLTYKGVVIHVVYVDAIFVSGNDLAGIEGVKEHMKKHFQTKDLDQLRYFLDIEVAQSK